MARVSKGDTTASVSFMGIRDEETLEGESETKVMASIGAGFEMLGERVGIFVEGRYQFNFPEFEEGRTDFASFRVGVRIRK